MKISTTLLCVLLISSVNQLGVAAGCQAVAENSTQPERQVAVTVDDLPAGSANAMDAATLTELTSRLVAALRDEKVPAVAFVNEQKLYKPGEVDQRIKTLSTWLDAGFELGNHTFSHSSLNKVGLRAFEDDVIQGESVTRMLLAQHNMKLRYFRHPYLDTGRDLQTRREVEEFLVGRGYRIAPVTLDAWDWMFGGVYEEAKRRGDTAFQKQIVDEYLKYTVAVFNYSEQLSRELVGYEPKQILLLHANQLEAEHFKELAGLIRKRGYRFITLEKALGDQIYSLPDMYIGEEGTGWLDHWAITRGKPPQGAPAFPAGIEQRYNAMKK